MASQMWSMVPARYYAAVTWAKQSGVMSGYGDGMFHPDDPITREQLAAMLHRFIEKYGLKPVTTPAGTISWTDQTSDLPGAKSPQTGT